MLSVGSDPANPPNQPFGQNLFVKNNPLRRSLFAPGWYNMSNAASGSGASGQMKSVHEVGILKPAIDLEFPDRTV